MIDADAIILAGGRGTRLRGAFDGPKCLAPVAGRPFLHWLLDQLVAAGFPQIILALGYGSNEIVSALASYSEVGINPSIEQHQIGEVGAARLASKRMKTNVGIVVNGDTYVRGVDFAALVDRHRDGAHPRATGIYARRDHDPIVHAGITIVDKTIFRTLRGSGRLADQAFVIGIEMDFVDVGTPEGLARAQEFVPAAAGVLT